MAALSPALHQLFPKIETAKPLAPLTTMQIGGPADFYYALEHLEELPKLLDEVQKTATPFVLLGGGSNIVFSEKGFRGLIIHIKAKNVDIQGDQIIADAGTLLSKVVQLSLQHHLTGMEKFMGLPGTVGGAVRGNAGAFGSEIKNVLQQAEIYTSGKGVRLVPAEYFHFGYRESVIKHNRDIVLKVWFQLKPQNNNEALQEALAIVKSRVGTQPSGKCSGSFFKNTDPFDPHKKAGYLLDQAGCKGLQVGDAKVSDLHANWIMNPGKATYGNILELSCLMQKKVQEKFGILLEREVQLVDETGFYRDPLLE